MAYQPSISVAAPVATLENVSPTMFGQTTFNLSSTPQPGTTVRVLLNQVPYTNGDEFTVSGTVLTWVGPFGLDTTDELLVEYYS